MFNKKAQMDIKELILTIVIAGVLFIVGLLIFANISNSAGKILDPTPLTIRNETFTINVEDDLGNTNSTLLARLGVIENSESVINVSGPSVTLTRNVDYSIALLNGDSGEFTTRGNLTLLNISGTKSFNNSLLSISYSVNTQSEAQASTQVVQSTVLDSFELGVIALIVLAAVIILAIVFKLGQ